MYYFKLAPLSIRRITFLSHGATPREKSLLSLAWQSTPDGGARTLCRRRNAHFISSFNLTAERWTWACVKECWSNEILSDDNWCKIVGMLRALHYKFFPMTPEVTFEWVLFDSWLITLCYHILTHTYRTIKNLNLLSLTKNRPKINISVVRHLHYNKGKNYIQNEDQ